MYICTLNICALSRGRKFEMPTVLCHSALDAESRILYIFFWIPASAGMTRKPWLVFMQAKACDYNNKKRVKWIWVNGPRIQGTFFT
jgi:hypothetical protein